MSDSTKTRSHNTRGHKAPAPDKDIAETNGTPTPAVTPPVPEQPPAPPVATPADRDGVHRAESFDRFEQPPTPTVTDDWSAEQWKEATQAAAVRRAADLLNERSPSRITKWLLDTHGIKVSGPQASKVLKDKFDADKPKPPDTQSIQLGIKAILSVQKFAAGVGGLEQLTEQVAQAERLVQFANTLGGLEALKSVLEAIRTQE